MVDRTDCWLLSPPAMLLILRELKRVHIGVIRAESHSYWFSGQRGRVGFLFPWDGSIEIVTEEIVAVCHRKTRHRFAVGVG
jgi:hypothetical protein